MYTPDTRKIYLGSQSISKVMLGGTQVWPKGGRDYSKEYFTTEFIGDGTVYLAMYTAQTVNLQYSRNGGEWTNVSSSAVTTINVATGDILQWRGNNTAFGRSEYSSSGIKGTAPFKAYGNVMSLTKNDEFEGASLTNNFELIGVLKGSKVVDAENLIFPEGTVPKRAMGNFFRDCTELVIPPKILPAKILLADAYGHIFEGCGAMTSAPVIAATSIGGDALNAGFAKCSGITSVEFSGYITSVGSYAFHYCFNKCTAFNSIRIKVWSGISKLVNPGTWMPTPAATGTFITNDPDAWRRGTNGIPSGWSVIEEP